MPVVSELAQKVRDRIRELGRIAPDSIGDLMHYEVLSDERDGDLIHMRCRTFGWMRNGPGTLHGGMCATVVDQAMGFVAFCRKPGPGVAPTVEMQVEYHRPLTPGEAVLVDVYTVSAGKNLMHFRAEAYAQDHPDKVCLTASATYFYKPAES